MENISYLLIKTSRYLKNRLDNELKEYNVTASQFSVLNSILNRNGRITSAEVASQLNSDRPTISGVINRLEDKGLLEKIDNPEDKRSAYLKLNEGAIDLVEKLIDVSDKLNYNVFSNFEEDELNNMKQYLLRIIDKVEGL